jgi:predicted TPR repeat methyltransferase
MLLFSTPDFAQNGQMESEHPTGKAPARRKHRPTGRRARVAEARRLGHAQRLFDEGAFAAADTLYARILARNPANLTALHGRADATLARLQTTQADSRNVKPADDLIDIADDCYTHGLHAAARSCYQRVLDLAPDRSEAVWGVAECHASLDEVDQAITWYRRYLDLVPDEPEALHMLAALGDQPSPGRASDDYVTVYFDRFAEDFDHQLVDELDYQVPRLLYDAVAPCLGDTDLQLDILDLGCGTGLSGSLFERHANRLDGVDLSPVMLERARQRGAYDALTAGEISAHLMGLTRHYDVLLAGDVLAYFGRLSGLFRGIARATREGALFAFSVEAWRGPGYRLTPSGRYVHARRYISRLAAAARLREVSVTREQLRFEYGEPVMGDIWVFERLPV